MRYNGITHKIKCRKPNNEQVEIVVQRINSEDVEKLAEWQADHHGSLKEDYMYDSFKSGSQTIRCGARYYFTSKELQTKN